MTVAKQHISSASLTGPYWADINFSPLLAIPDVRPSASGSACLLGVVRTQMPPAEGLCINPLVDQYSVIQKHCHLDRKAGPESDAWVVPSLSLPHFCTGIH